MASPVLVVYAPGLSVDLAVRGDSVPNLSDLIADGAFASLKPVFPVLDGPNLATFATGKTPEQHGVLDDAHLTSIPGVRFVIHRGILEAGSAHGPRSRETLKALMEFDEHLGGWRREAKTLVVLSAYGLTEVTKSIPTTGPAISQIAYPREAPAETEHVTIAGRLILMAPPGTSFVAEKGAHGRLARDADHGIFATSVPMPTFRPGARVRAMDVASILKSLQ